MANPTSPQQPGKAGTPSAQPTQPQKSPGGAPAASPLRQKLSALPNQMKKLFRGLFEHR